MYVVKQPFNTPSQRFAVGAEVSSDELAGPVPVSRWLEKKFIEPAKPPKGQKGPPPDTPAEAAA